ncbi:hypothetical protein [Kitasatospora griseola]|uniref:hypothetical protein n=1 Tax=Kitasatospora griseola TaxID=2064 RepID=UPI00382C917D
MLQRILSGWYELALPLPHLEQHLAERTDYVVQVHHTGLPQSAQRIAKYLAEDHAQPAAAIGHLHDWLTDAMGTQLRGDWVAFLGRVQDARGLTVDQRADFVVIAEMLCFPPQPSEHATGLELLVLAEAALASGSPALLLLEIDRLDEQLAQQARTAVERSRAYVPHVPRPPRYWPVAAVVAVLLTVAGVVTAALLPGGPPPLPDREVSWSPPVVEPQSESVATVNVPPEAHRLVAHIQLTDPNPTLGSCTDLKVSLSTGLGEATDWQAPDATLSVAVPPGYTGLALSLHLKGTQGCNQTINTQRVEFER